MIMSDLFFDKIKTRFKRLFTKSNWNLLLELIRANFKTSDYSSILGILWSFINPIVMLIIMYLIFNKQFGQEIKAYPLYILVGIICVNFFTVTTTYIMRIFFINRTLILNSTIPRENLIASSLFTFVYKFFIELMLCLVLSILYGHFSWKLILLLFPLFVAYIALVLGTSIILSLAYCFARDIEHIWMLLTRIFYFVTPIFYSIRSIPPIAQKAIYFGNPLTAFVISFRGIFMGMLDMASYMYSLILGCGFFILGYYAFIGIENTALERA